MPPALGVRSCVASSLPPRVRCSSCALCIRAVVWVGEDSRARRDGATQQGAALARRCCALRALRAQHASGQRRRFRGALSCRLRFKGYLSTFVFWGAVPLLPPPHCDPWDIYKQQTEQSSGAQHTAQRRHRCAAQHAAASMRACRLAPAACTRYRPLFRLVYDHTVTLWLRAIVAAGQQLAVAVGRSSRNPQNARQPTLSSLPPPQNASRQPQPTPQQQAADEDHGRHHGPGRGAGRGREQEAGSPARGTRACCVYAPRCACCCLHALLLLRHGSNHCSGGWMASSGRRPAGHCACSPAPAVEPSCIEPS